MSKWNGLIDSPPPVEVARRFNEDLAAAVMEYQESPTHDNGEAIRVVLGAEELAPDATGRLINERRGRIATLLGELDSEAKGLAEDLGFLPWRQDPTLQYRPAVLSVSRQRRPAAQLSVRELLEDFGDIAASSTGHVSRDRPRPPITIQDFSKQPRVSVPQYVTGVPGDEGPDSHIQVVGGREVTA